MGNAAKTLTDAWWWFRNTLAGLGPDSAASVRAGVRGCILEIESRGCRLAGRDEVELADCSDPEQLVELISASDGATAGKRRNIALKMNPGSFVLRPLSALVLPESRQRAMAELDLTASTPFSADETYLYTTRSYSAPQSASYVIVRRNIVDPVFEAARRSGTRVSALRFEHDGMEYQLTPAAWHGLRRRLDGGRRRPGLPVAACLVVLGLAATLVHAHAIQARARQSIDTSLESLGEQARAVRAELDRRTDIVAAIDAQRSNVASALRITEVWEELARALPDSAYLTDMTVSDDVVTVVGFAAAASMVIVALEGSPMFDKAEFTAPVIRIPGQEGERFTVNLTMAGH